jgi:tetratricopeptide (TPR) repeat protein
VDTLREIGELSFMSTVAGILAEAVYAQGRYDEVEPFLKMCEETAGSEDVYSQVLLRSIRAKLLARQGSTEGAERLGREAVAVAEPTDFLFLQAFALLSLGEVHRLCGRPAEAAPVLDRAIRVCERKGFTVGADRARELLAAAEGTRRATPVNALPDTDAPSPAIGGASPDTRPGPAGTLS